MSVASVLQVKKLPKAVLAGSAATLVIAGVSIYMLMSYHSRTNVTPTVQVRAGSITSVITVTGQIDASDKLSLKSPSGGMVLQLLVEPGSHVQSGDVIAKLNGYDLAKQNYDTMKKKLDQAKEQVDLANRKLNETSGQAASSSVIAQDKATLDMANKQLTAAKTLAADAQQNLDDAKKLQQSAISDAKSKVDQAMATVNESKNQLKQATGTDAMTAAQQKLTAAQADLQAAQTAYQELLNTPASGVMSAQAALDQANLSLVSYEGQVEQAKEKVAAYKTPTDANASLPDKQTLVQLQQAETDAELEVAKAQTELQTQEVTAPFAGTVVDVAKRQGDQVNLGDEVCTLLPNELKQQVVGVLSASDTLQVRAGDKVTIESTQWNQKATGTVRFVSPVPESDTNGNLLQYKVYLDVDNLPSQAKPGMIVSLKIQTNQSNHASLLPVGAIQMQNGKRGIYEKNSQTGAFDFKEVKIGASDDQNVEVENVPLGTIVALEKPQSE